MNPSPFVGPPNNPFWPFFALTGVTFVTFASGFGVCLFDISQVDACVSHAVEWVDRFREVGDEILAWAVKLVQNILHRYPLVGQ